MIGQQALEGVLRSHLEKYGCTVELNTELESFEQTDDHVLAKLVKKVDGKEVPETFEASYLIGADGGRGMFSPLIFRLGLILCVISVGICRKLLGSTFLGDTRDEMNSVVGDICMEVDGIDREV